MRKMMDNSSEFSHSVFATGFVCPYLQHCSKTWPVKWKGVSSREYCCFLRNGQQANQSVLFVILKGQVGDQNNTSDKKDKKGESDLFRFRPTRKGGVRGDNIEEKNTKRVLNVWSSETGFLVGIVFVFILFLFYLYEYLNEYYFN
ncbi:hypothetical protein GpartN1_g1587.t1 [Galdieria partita]|uniref:Uncharacterized protein n=1 Tax=Galdieria partita TaxID=83374 RepID=A0A9C7PTX6_9RHOD|nr:hypothetical protein GpartN1_g1587.t1 [Galdieria partita]